MNSLRYFDFGTARPVLLLIARIAVVLIFIIFGFPKMMGFGGTVNDMGRERALKALGEFLRPEFINRVDEIVYFNSLTEENFRSIAELMLEETRNAIAERGISMTWNTALVDYLVRKSYSVTYGARNLRRTIQKDVEDAIAQKIIDCRGENAGHISVSADDNGVIVEVGE